MKSTISLFYLLLQNGYLTYNQIMTESTKVFVMEIGLPARKKDSPVSQNSNF